MAESNARHTDDTHTSRSRRRKWPWVLLILVVLLAAGGVAGYPKIKTFLASHGIGGPKKPQPSVEPADAKAAGVQFLQAWQKKDFKEMQALLLDQGDNMERVYGGMDKRLGIQALTLTPGELGDITAYAAPGTGGAAAPTANGTGGASGASASSATAGATPQPVTTQGVTYTAVMKLTGLTGELKYTSAVPVTKDADDHYRVAFTAATVYPKMTTGQRLDLVSLPAPPPTINDRTGKPLRSDEDLAVNLLGTPASDTKGATGLYRVLQVGAASDGSTQPASGASSDAATAQSDAVTDGAASDSTASDASGSDGSDAASSSASPSASASGERADVTYGGRVAVVNADKGDVVKTVTKLEPETAAPPVKPVNTTLDLAIQKQATAALAKAPGKAAMVVMDTATGEVRALVNKPTQGLPPAIVGAYPPGSTFKIITATAALQNGVTPTTSVKCPATFTVNGRKFVNYEDEKFPSLSFEKAFALSCNTAFISVAQNLPKGALQKAAELYGFNAGEPLPISSRGGSYPATKGEVEHAASAIGQGRVTASPLQMASVAAGVASGTWHQPRVLPCPTCAQHPIPVADQLRGMMRQVVVAGTGTPANVPGTPVFGKTGTAEFGKGSPPPTHAWFVGYRGNLAFAVFVERGKSGGSVAAPLAATFLRGK